MPFFLRSMKRNQLYLFVITLFLTLYTHIAIAEEPFYVEDEGLSLWEEEGFIDATGEESEFEIEDGKYVSEEEVRLREEALKKMRGPEVDIAAALKADKKLLPDNILYGIGTGVVIGGWFALLQGKNARQNVQYISLGIVVGVSLSILVGTKSLYKAAVDWPKDEFERRFDKSYASTADTEIAIALIDYEFRF